MKKLISMLAVAGTLLVANAANADVCNPGDIDFDPIQCSEGGGEGGPSTPPAAPAVPVDGGASMLFAAGAAYGLKRLRSKRA